MVQKLTVHHPNLSKILERQQAMRNNPRYGKGESSEGYKDMVKIDLRTGGREEGRGQQGQIIQIQEVDNTLGMIRGDQKGSRREGKQTSWGGSPSRGYYTVESPEDSPGKDSGILMLQTGLSPLLHNVNLKRKHDADTESEEDKMENTRSKRQRQATGNELLIQERTDTGRQGKAQGKKGVGKKK